MPMPIVVEGSLHKLIYMGEKCVDKTGRIVVYYKLLNDMVVC